MSRFDTGIAEIDRVRFERFPTRPVKGLRLVRHEGVVAATKAEPTTGQPVVYTDSKLVNVRQLEQRAYRHLCLLEATRRLGVISDDVHKRMLDEQRQRERIESWRQDARRFLTVADAVGINLTAAQREQLRKVPPAKP